MTRPCILAPGARDSAPNSSRAHWDDGISAYVVRIVAGEYYVSLEGEAISTVLGSCISACVRDAKLGIGGMNHFMLPGEALNEDQWAGTTVSSAARYGSYAMEHLINAVLKDGGQRERLEVKIFGGGRVLTGVTDIGRRNIEFVLEYLRTEGLALTASDVGGSSARRINYFPDTGRVQMKRLRSAGEAVVERERSYQATLKQESVAGGIDLF